MRGFRKTLGVILGLSVVGVTGVRRFRRTGLPRFTQAEGRTDTDGLPLSGVKLCVLPDRAPCFEMPPAPLPTRRRSFTSSD